jgi:peptide/nickel transport system substrate-binding protein
VDQSVTLEPNERWWGAVKPSLDTLVFRIITDQTAEVPALQSGEVNAIYPQPNQDIVDGVKAIQGVSYISSQGLTWEHLDLNTANPLLADLELRKAIFTAIDREDIIARTVGVFTEGLTPLGSHNFVPGQAGYQDLVTASGQGGGDVDAAKAILTAAGYTGVGTDLKTPAGVDVAIRFSFTQGNTLRQQTGELVQSYLAPLGIDVTLTPISSLGGTLVSGDFDLIIFAWVLTPFRIGGAKQLWTSTSSSNYGKWVNAESDRLINEANALVGEDAKAFDLINQANQLMVADAYVLPLFQRETFITVNKQYTNLRPNPTNHGTVYNIGAWGLLDQAQ